MNNDEEQLIIEKIPIIKKYKKNYKFTLLLLIIFLFIFGSFFCKIIFSKQTGSNQILINRLSALESELVKSQNINDMKKAEIFILKKELKMQQEKVNNNKLKQISKYIASEEMKGKGLEIIISEKPKENIENSEDGEFSEQMADEQKILHNEDLLRFVNFLWSKEALGVSVNNIRLLADSKIICNGPVIRINENIVTPPFVIKVIGKNLSEEMVKKSASVISLELRGMEVSIKEKDIILPQKQEKQR